MRGSNIISYPFPQVPLPLEGQFNGRASHAVLFIGGFCDCWAGRSHRLYANIAPLASNEVRAYYHWDGVGMGLVYDRCDSIVADVQQWSQEHPGCPILLIGHSYGGSAAMHVARCLKPKLCPIAVLTLDPVSRRQSSERAESVDYWAHTWQQSGGGWADVIPRIGGRWGSCSDADVNVPLVGKGLFRAGVTHGRPDFFLCDPVVNGESLIDLGTRWLNEKLRGF